MTITKEQIAQSVIAVPPLARNADFTLNKAANRAIVDYIKGGRVTSFLYGGNANFYHIRPSEFADILAMLTDFVDDDTWIIPSVGPAYGMMMDQAQIVKEFDFPTVMVLPHRELATSCGIAAAVRQFVDVAGVPIVLYIKHDGWIDVPSVKKLVDDGCVSMIKYAIVRDDTSNDDYLKEITAQVDPQIIVSGIGEQPAIIHLRDFGLAGFTSGCVCVAPGMSMRMMQPIGAADYNHAQTLRTQFQPLEDLRNAIHPIRVLHDAVSLAEIAETGPILPLLTHTSEQQQHEIKQAAVVLKQIEQSTMV